MVRILCSSELSGITVFIKELHQIVDLLGCCLCVTVRMDRLVVVVLLVTVVEMLSAGGCRRPPSGARRRGRM